jgi:hypothetical protein
MNFAGKGKTMKAGTWTFWDYAVFGIAGVVLADLVFNTRSQTRSLGHFIDPESLHLAEPQTVEDSRFAMPEGTLTIYAGEEDIGAVWEEPDKSWWVVLWPEGIVRMEDFYVSKKNQIIPETEKRLARSGLLEV